MLKHREKRIGGVVNLCYSVLNTCCKELKKDSNIYHHQGKRLVNNLLEFLSSRMYVVKTTLDKDSDETEKEDLTEEQIMVHEYMDCVVKILLDGGPRDVHESLVALRNIRDGKRMYTEEELKILLDKKC